MKLETRTSSIIPSLGRNEFDINSELSSVGADPVLALWSVRIFFEFGCVSEGHSSSAKRFILFYTGM